MSYISCSTVRHFAEAFVKDELSNKLHDEIVDHIIGCEKCFNYIVTIAKKLGCTAIIEKSTETLSLVEPTPKKDVPTISKGVYNLYDTWTDASKACDLSVLMQLKAVRDSVTEKYEVPEGESEIFRKFGLFIIKKICQKIDHLETCYKLEEAVRKQ